MNARELRLPKLRASATFEPTTLEEKGRRVEVRFYSGATVERQPIFSNPYKLTFALGGAKLERLNAGAPLLANHDDWSLDSVLGVVEKAWIGSDGGHAIVRFSERADVEPIFADVRAGILRNVSMGAVIHELEDVTPKGAKMRELRATSWEVHELSLVPIGADAAAQTLSADGDTYPCRLKEQTMDPIDKDQEPELTPKQELSELRRRERIRELTVHFEAGDIRAQQLIINGTSIDDAVKVLTRERAERQPHIDGSLPNSVLESWDRGPRKLERMAGGIAARALGVEPADAARQFAHFDFVAAAREILRDSGRAPWLPTQSRAEIIRLAHTTSDFPLLVGDTAHRMLRPAYETAVPTYRKLAQLQNLKDFRPQRLLKVGDFPLPLQVGEGGEIKQGTFSESGETALLLTYGRIISFSRQLLVNDDLGAMTRVMGEYARRIADLENALFFAMLTSASGLGPTLSDTVAFFNLASHGNYTASGTAIDVSSIGVGMALLRKQTSLDGLKLNLAGRYLLVSPDKETLARQYCAAINPAIASSVNPFGGVLEPLADANLSSANPWYLAADPAIVPGFVYGSLESEPGPRVMTRPGFEVEGVDLRVAIDFYVAALEHRAWYRNAGA